MISTIFGKTKPIVYIILMGFIFFFYWFVHFFMFKYEYASKQILFQTIVLAAVLLSIFIANFIAKRNQITGTNSYTILFYTMLIVIFPEVLADQNAIFCSFFLLLALRRLISLRSLKSTKLKIFDATLWIVVASFFYDWAALYLLLVYIAIYFYDAKNIRNWLVPLAGLFTAFIILTGLLLLYGNIDFIINHYTFSLDLDTIYFIDLGKSTKLALYAIFTILIGFLTFLKLGKHGLGRIITMRLLAIALVIGFLITFLKSSPKTFPVLLTFFPAAILFTKYVEIIKKINIKEIVLIAAVIAPFLIFLAELIIK